MTHPTTPLEELRHLIENAIEFEASDLHLAAEAIPMVRRYGLLTQLNERPLSQTQMDRFAEFLGGAENLSRLQTTKNIDCSLQIEIRGETKRFRVNLCVVGESYAACLRLIGSSIPSFDWANFPIEVAQRVTSQLDGLVIVTGATGSGKSTTLAMLVQSLNEAGGCRIITIEEPIEYRYPTCSNSLVTQREVGVDVHSFADGLKYGLRQDPDVMLVGEIRDRETAQIAMTAAETGHLVLTTLHTRDAKGAVSRITDMFPVESQRDIRYQLASSLRVVLAQRLLPNADSAERPQLALEIMWNSNPVAASIRQGKLESIDNYLLTRPDDGMLSLDESLRRLLRAGKITRETAERHAKDSNTLNRL